MLRSRGFRLISAILAVALVIAIAPAAGAITPQAAAPIADPDAPDVADRPDRVSAMVAARTQKSRVEDLSARTPTTATYANPDGTWTTEAFAGIVRSKTDDDQWVRVDPSVERAGGAFEPKAAPIDAQYSDGGDKTVGTVSNVDGSSVEVGWPTKLPVPQADGDQLTYPDAVPGGDLVVESRADGFGFSVLLDQAPAAEAPQLEYRVPLRFGGVTAVDQADGTIVLKDGGKRVGVMTPPVMWDDANKAEGGERHPVGVTVEGDGDARTLVLKPDMNFLRDPSTTYPVTVDPDVYMTLSGDTYAESTSSSGQPTSPELRVGSTTLGITKARSYLAFDMSQLANTPVASIASAQLKLSNFDTGSCTGSAVRVSRITDPFTISTIKWTNKPATDPANSSTSTVTWGGASCPGEGVVSWDAKGIVTDAKNAGTTTLGLEVKADSEVNTSGYRKYRSMDNGDPNKVPQLVVTVNQVPNTPTGLSVSPGNPGYATSVTPTLSAVVSDPDAGQTRGFFEVKSGSTVVWSGSSAWATSGSRVNLTVPSGQLVDGTTYTVSAYSEDAHVKSAAPATSTIKVDVTAPVAALSATGFSNNTWSSPSTNTFTWSGPTDTATYEMVLDGVPVSLKPNSGSNYTYPAARAPMIPNGWHTWQAAAVDQAGNRGPSVTWNFGSWYPGFTTPQANAPTTGAFPIDVSAPPGATSAYLKWKPKNVGSYATITKLTKAGSPWTGSVTAATGRSTTGQLVWDATSEPYGTGTITAPMTISIYACFVYSSGEQCTGYRTIQLVPSAFGGNFPTADVGPASVALFTGESAISGIDAADTVAGISRTYSSYDDATLSAGLFGPGWSTSMVSAPSPGSQADVIDNRSKDGTFVIEYPTSETQAFVSDGGSTTQFVPVVPTGDATKLVFTLGVGGAPDRLELKRPLGSAIATTTWTLATSDTGGATGWVFDSVDAPGGFLDVGVTNDHQRPTWIRESAPAAATTCTLATQTEGCRGLKVTYTGTGAATRVASIVRLIGAATPGGVAAKTLATYNYDGSGRLSSVCSAAPAAGTPSLCTSYTYTTVAGRTLLAEAKPAGLKSWRFNYDTTGRLISAKREKPTGGDLTWSVDYSLALTSPGLPTLNSTTAAQWGQTVIPTHVYAVYDPFLGTTNVNKATLYYTTAGGEATNTAAYGPSGWLFDTRWYDEYGNVIRHLDGLGWARVQAAATADQPSVAVDSSSYFAYNTWGDKGTELVDEYGPTKTATREDGVTVGLYRDHVHHVFDDDPDVDPALIADRPDGSARGLPVKEIHSVANAARSADYDQKITTFAYAPAVAGDGDGWVLGSPTKISEQVDSSNWLTRVERFDTSGREIETRRPGGSADSAGRGTDAMSTVTSYYTGSGTGGDCVGKPEWEGLTCKVSPADSSGLPVIYTSSYDANLSPSVVQEIVDGTVTRTTSDVYDGLDRLKSRTVVTSGTKVANESRTTTYVYDDTTGLLTSVGDGATTVATSYDSWGRVAGTTDSAGTSGSRTYDDADRLSTYSDGSATYTYAYDSLGQIASVDAGGGVGTYSFGYTSAGAVNTVTYPNNMVETRSYDEAGAQTGVAYTQGSTKVLEFTGTRSADGRILATSSTASRQAYSYDGVGRLVKTEDFRDNGCTTRRYGFDNSSNRSSTTVYSPAADSTCQATVVANSRSLAFDAAGRTTSAGYSYDTLGRLLSIPKVDANPTANGDLTATYHANDRIASLTQNLQVAGTAKQTVMTYAQDAAMRPTTIVTSTNGTESSRTRYRYGDSSATPAQVDTSSNGGVSWVSTRYVSIPGLGMTASVTGGSVVQNLSNLQGDTVATVSNSSGATAILGYSESDEYGNPITTSSSGSRYGWKGTSQVDSETPGAALKLTGARVYNPATGLFAQTDPIDGGGATQYGYPYDPVNMEDLTGSAWKWGAVVSANKLSKQGQLFIDTANSLDKLNVKKGFNKLFDFVQDRFIEILGAAGLGSKGIVKVVKVVTDILKKARSMSFMGGWIIEEALDWSIKKLRAVGKMWKRAANDALVWGSDMARTGWDSGKVYVDLAAQSYRTCLEPIYKVRVGKNV